MSAAATRNPARTSSGTQEPEDLPAVTDAVRRRDQRPLPGHVVSDPHALDVEKLGHAALQKAIDISL